MAERAGSTMKVLVILLLVVSTVSLAEEYNRHSISVSFVPFMFYSFIPDVGYKYYLSSNDAIGFSTILAVVNRVTYTRKMGNFGLTGSLGFAADDFDLEEGTTFATVTGEHRIHMSDHFYTRTVAGVIFSGVVDMPVIPFLQIGAGFEF
jgi:hypothetical protein